MFFSTRLEESSTLKSGDEENTKDHLNLRAYNLIDFHPHMLMMPHKKQQLPNISKTHPIDHKP